eukprot:scaffold54107_cov30-Tisochrysis_lutea.AAC.5
MRRLSPEDASGCGGVTAPGNDQPLISVTTGFRALFVRHLLLRYIRQAQPIARMAPLTRMAAATAPPIGAAPLGVACKHLTIYMCAKVVNVTVSIICTP